MAFLSTLLPDMRTDKVYELKEKSLEKVISRALSLSTSRYLDLVRWRDPGAGDLGDCLERVQKQAVRIPPMAGNYTKNKCVLYNFDWVSGDGFATDGE